MPVAALSITDMIIFLFDEIEKADPSILDKFLQILGDGRLTDGLFEVFGLFDQALSQQFLRHFHFSADKRRS